MKLIFVGTICLSLLNNILGDEGKGNNLNLKKNKFSVNQTVWRNNAMKNQCRQNFNVVKLNRNSVVHSTNHYKTAHFCVMIIRKVSNCQ